MTTTTTNLRNRQGNWIEGTVLNGLKVSAKVFEEPSDTYGMPTERRISQLWVGTPGSHRLVLVDFDRHGDEPFTNCLKDEVLAEICADLVAFRLANPVT